MTENEIYINQIYINQMESWFKEQEARREQIIATIETSSEIVKQNKIQLEWHDKRVNLAKKEFEDWKKEGNEQHEQDKDKREGIKGN